MGCRRRNNLRRRPPYPFTACVRTALFTAHRWMSKPPPDRCASCPYSLSENFMFGLPGSADAEKIFLIDFGLSSRSVTTVISTAGGSWCGSFLQALRPIFWRFRSYRLLDCDAALDFVCRTSFAAFWYPLIAGRQAGRQTGRQAYHTCQKPRAYRRFAAFQSLLNSGRQAGRYTCQQPRSHPPPLVHRTGTPGRQAQSSRSPMALRCRAPRSSCRSSATPAPVLAGKARGTHRLAKPVGGVTESPMGGGVVCCVVCDSVGDGTGALVQGKVPLQEQFLFLFCSGCLRSTHFLPAAGLLNTN